MIRSSTARTRVSATMLFVSFFLTQTGGCIVPASEKVTTAQNDHRAAHALSEQSQFVPGQLLIKFNDRVSGDRVADLLKQHDTSVVRDFSDQHLYLVALPPGISVERGVRLFANLAEVEFAEPNHIYRPED